MFAVAVVVVVVVVAVVWCNNTDIAFVIALEWLPKIPLERL